MLTRNPTNSMSKPSSQLNHNPVDEATTPRLKQQRKSQTGKLLRREKKTRRVSFNKRVHVKLSLHLNNYTDQEILDTWFTEHEYQDMKESTQALVSLVEQQQEQERDLPPDVAQTIEEESDCGGILVHTAEGRRVRALRKSHARFVVFKEQHKQFECGVFDEDYMAFLYEQVSAVSKEEALRTASSNKS